ncbi:ChbG/HpnK family deacetylase [bacterium]|nr:ChbG/HpnK family deacetylase [bacterium]
MSNKKFILNADDFGMSNAYNRAVLDGYNNGFLTSASICANGEAFGPAVNEVLPECPNLGIGVHLNIIEGSSLLRNEEIPLLVNKDGKFKNGYSNFMALSLNKNFLEQAEKEFRTQIEMVMQYVVPDHIDSHVHVHAIPSIFDLTCKLAKEYGIGQVRTQYEKFYTVPKFSKHLSLKYPPNLLKIMLLNSFTKRNMNVVKEFGLKTNDYLIGVGYTGMMDDDTLYYGLNAINDDCVAESLIHPCVFSDKNMAKNQHSVEFRITQNQDLKDKIQRLGFEITNYKND